jgi:hypothetical protein
MLMVRGSAGGLPLARGLAISARLRRGCGQQRVRVQDVDLDVLREDAERYVDRTGRTCGVKQGPEDGFTDLSGAFLGQR